MAVVLTNGIAPYITHVANNPANPNFGYRKTRMQEPVGSGWCVTTCADIALAWLKDKDPTNQANREAEMHNIVDSLPAANKPSTFRAWIDDGNHALGKVRETAGCPDYLNVLGNGFNHELWNNCTGVVPTNIAYALRGSGYSATSELGNKIRDKFELTVKRRIKIYAGSAYKEAKGKRTYIEITGKTAEQRDPVITRYADDLRAWWRNVAFEAVREALAGENAVVLISAVALGEANHCLLGVGYDANLIRIYNCFPTWYMQNATSEVIGEGHRIVTKYLIVSWE